MPTNHIDPDRIRPGKTSCYEKGCNAADPERSRHSGWRHAESWDEVQDWLDNDLSVMDHDGDKIVRVVSPGQVEIVGGGHYSYPAETILIEDLQLVEPTTPEEEDAAMASILEAMKNNRLSN